MSLAHMAQQHPRVVDWSIRIDRLPAAGWLALQFAALMPTWVWMALRMRDGSDDPLGALALAGLAALVWQLRRELRAAPRLGWLALATVGTVLAAVSRTGLPPLAAGLIAVLALACGLLAFLPKRRDAGPPQVAAAPPGGSEVHAVASVGAHGPAALPVAGMAVLALPLLSSLQFYAGYPLRVITAEASRWLLAPGFSVAREGSSLMVDGRLVIVDAPCSGVQMVWLGYFTACAVALWAQRSDRSFGARLPVVGALVLVGNIVRNAVLVAFEGAGQPMPGWAHNAFGLVVLALVCGGIAWTMVRPSRTARSSRPAPAVAIAGLITSTGGRRVDTAL